jgi:hypothetical protein
MILSVRKLRGRAGKEVTNGSKTVERTCACSQDGFSGENGDRAWGMYYRKAAFCCAFFVGKITQSKFIKKRFQFTMASVCHLEKFSQGRSKVADDETEVGETTVKRLLCCGFQRTGKTLGHVYQCWWGICRKVNVFPGSNITCFTFYIHLWSIYWLSLVYMVEGRDWGKRKKSLTKS